MHRRQLLAALPVAALAGCSTALDDGDDGSSQPNDAENDSGDAADEPPADSDCQVTKSLLSAEPVTLTAEQRTHVVPVVVSEQTESVTIVLERSIDGEEITACPTGSPTSETAETLAAAIDVIDETLQRQREQYDGDPPNWVDQTAYLQFEDDLFVCRARLSDVVVSIGTPPADTASA
ncbi:hypothetical protein GCM10028857_26480 [Salinarchaeum chitinilyticum]